MQSERTSDGFDAEVARGERFEFGRNWQRYLGLVGEPVIAAAVRALRSMLDVEDLAGRTFLDVGSGSGIHSLAAHRLGARVTSFDYDPESVRCTEQLRDRYAPGERGWTIVRGSALDAGFLGGLGRFDVVYAWGVLHHTGDLWRALELTTQAVAPDGRLFLAIYNDEGRRSVRWRNIKRLYCSGPLGRAAMSMVFIPYLLVYDAKETLLRGENPLKRWFGAEAARGMSPVRDWFDWLGGYPFEVARPETVVRFCRERGLVCDRLTTGAGSGCNEYVFTREAGHPPAKAND
jgi:2-polyprenyl-6-hydroxyphenyl methylase/3-demethylubiquinone-9 3-methyltransferase